MSRFDRWAPWWGLLVAPSAFLGLLSVAYALVPYACREQAPAFVHLAPAAELVICAIGVLLSGAAIMRWRREAVAAVPFRSSPRVDSLSAAFFKRRVIEKSVRARIQDLACERRRLRQVARDASDLALLDSAQHSFQSVDVHRLCQAIINRLLHQRVIWNLPVADDVLEARQLIGKNCSEKVF